MPLNSPTKKIKINQAVAAKSPVQVRGGASTLKMQGSLNYALIEKLKTQKSLLAQGKISNKANKTKDISKLMDISITSPV